MTRSSEVQARKKHLIAEAHLTLDAIRNLAGPGVDDPWVDPPTLAKAVTAGVLDAPQLMNNSFGRGMIRTQIVGGACEAVDETGRVLSEKERLSKLM
jgi:hypothetical protein